MDNILKFLILALFLVVIFGRSLFPSDFLYWSVYFLMFILTALLWFSMFWVSRRRNAAVLGYEPNAHFFVGKVAPDVREDLQRGRLSFKDGRITLVGKQKGRYCIIWTADIKSVRSVGFSKVAGVRKGFILHTDDGDVPFTSSKLFKNRQLLFDALGWDVKKEAQDVQK